MNVPLLPFADVWESLESRPFAFETQLKAGDALNLEALRHLSSLRRRAVEKRGSDLLEQIGILEEYWFHLQGLKSKEEEFLKQEKKQPMFEWNSPLGMRDVISHRLFGFQQEGIMVFFLCGCGLREKAFAGSQQMVSEGTPSPVDVAVMFREAAGFFKYLHDTVHQNLEDDFPADRPTESVAAMAICFENICLAEAQAIIAHRAAEKNSSPGTVAALHVGTSDLFEEASKVLRETTGSFNVISDRLRRFIAISSSIHTTRALQHMARDEISKGQAGKAVKCCEEARKNLRDCLTVAEGTIQWIARLKLENDALREFKESCDRERTSVYMQTVATLSPELVPGKILAKHVEYVPKEMQSLL